MAAICGSITAGQAAGRADPPVIRMDGAEFETAANSNTDHGRLLSAVWRNSEEIYDS